MAASCEDSKETDEAGLGLVDALEPFKVKLDLKPKKSTSAAAEGSADASMCEVVFMSLTHRDTFHTFEGLFSNEDLAKLKFNPYDPIEADLQLIQDAFYGAHSDITLQCGFMNFDDESDLKHEYFDGAYLGLKIKEVYRGRVHNYEFVLKPKEVSAFERQSNVNAALRESVKDLSATLATLKTEHSREMFELKKEIEAKFDNELRTLKARMASLTQRTVTFFERITAKKSRAKGWSNIALNCGQFGYESAKGCSFAQLEDGYVRITADGDYELAANWAVGFSDASGMQLVVCGTDGRKRLLDAVGGGYHYRLGGTHTSICRVDGVWLPIAAGSTVTMRVYVGYSHSRNAWTDSSLMSEMKDKSMPVSSVSIRKLC